MIRGIKDTIVNMIVSDPTTRHRRIELGPTTAPQAPAWASDANLKDWAQVGLTNEHRQRAAELIHEAKTPRPRTAMEKLRMKSPATLTLDGMRLSSLPDQTLGQLRNVQQISVRDNQITSLPGEALKQLKQVTHLDLSTNRLEVLPPETGEMVGLKSLNVANNRLAPKQAPHGMPPPPPPLPETLGQLINLESFTLTNNQVTSLPESLGSMGRLKSLLAAQNRIFQIPDSIDRLQRLETLDMSDNQLIRVTPAIGSATQLKWLNLSNNQLTDFPDAPAGAPEAYAIPQSISSLRNLESLNVSGNPHLRYLPTTLGALVYKLDMKVPVLGTFLSRSTIKTGGEFWQPWKSRLDIHIGGTQIRPGMEGAARLNPRPAGEHAVADNDDQAWRLNEPPAPPVELRRMSDLLGGNPGSTFPATTAPLRGPTPAAVPGGSAMPAAAYTLPPQPSNTAPYPAFTPMPMPQAAPGYGPQGAMQPQPPGPESYGYGHWGPSPQQVYAWLQAQWGPPHAAMAPAGFQHWYSWPQAAGGQMPAGDPRMYYGPGAFAQQVPMQQQPPQPLGHDWTEAYAGSAPVYQGALAEQLSGQDWNSLRDMQLEATCATVNSTATRADIDYESRLIRQAGGTSMEVHNKLRNLARGLFRQKIINEMVVEYVAWAAPGADPHPLSLALQTALADEFALPLAVRKLKHQIMTDQVNKEIFDRFVDVPALIQPMRERIGMLEMANSGLDFEQFLSQQTFWQAYKGPQVNTWKQGLNAALQGLPGQS